MEEEIEERIDEELPDFLEKGAEIEGIGASASLSLGVDQSIDTLKMEEYDHMEEVMLR